MASSSDAPLRLVIVDGDSPIPRYPFVDTWFPVRIYVEKGGQMTRIKEATTVGDDEVNLRVSLVYEGSSTGPSFDDAISVEDERGGPAVLNPNGITSLRMKIKTLSLHHENKSFIATIHVASKYNVQSVSTPPMTIVSYRLLLSFTNLPEDGDHRCWYKDEGGTSNKIDLSVVLQGPPSVPSSFPTTTTTRAAANASASGAAMKDEKDDAVKGRRIPLRVSLLYASGQPVLSKDMLSVSTATNAATLADTIAPSADGATHIEISELTGRVTLRLRINDVSKNHQRQAFKMLVAPDIASDPLLGDVSSATSPSLEVKSKRSKTAKRKEHAEEADKDAKRSRPETLGGDSAASATGAMGGTGFGLGQGGAHGAGAGAVSWGNRGSVAASGTPHRDGVLPVHHPHSAQASLLVRDQHATDTQPPRRTSTNPNPSASISQRPSRSRLSESNHGSGGSSVGSATASNPLSAPRALAPPAHISAGQLTDPQWTGVGLCDPSDGPLALATLHKWLQLAGDTVAALRWQLVGFAQDPLGRVDEGQPLYAMSNPNGEIDEVLKGLEAVRSGCLGALSTFVYQQAANGTHPHLNPHLHHPPPLTQYAPYYAPTRNVGLSMYSGDPSDPTHYSKLRSMSLDLTAGHDPLASAVPFGDMASFFNFSLDGMQDADMIATLLEQPLVTVTVNGGDGTGLGGSNVGGSGSGSGSGIGRSSSNDNGNGNGNGNGSSAGNGTGNGNGHSHGGHSSSHGSETHAFMHALGPGVPLGPGGAGAVDGAAAVLAHELTHLHGLELLSRSRSASLDCASGGSGSPGEQSVTHATPAGGSNSSGGGGGGGTGSGGAGGSAAGGVLGGKVSLLPMPPADAKVHYILAKQTTLYGTTDTARATRRTGIPAFDQGRRLLGFYEEVLDASRATTIAFVPLAEVVVDGGDGYGGAGGAGEGDAGAGEGEDEGEGTQRAVATIMATMEAAFGASERSRRVQGTGQGEGQVADPFLQTFDSSNGDRSDAGSAGTGGGWSGVGMGNGDFPSCHLFSLPRSFFDKEKLKQDAMMHCWMAEMEMSFV